MSIENNLVLFKHLRANEGKHVPSCTKRWLDTHGLSFRQFYKQGYTVGELRGVCSSGLDEGLEQLIAFIDKNKLWEEDEA